MYAQTDGSWATRQLGSSPFLMRSDGCYVTSIADLLSLADRTTNPGEVLDALEAHNGFTPDGEVIHSAVTEAFPEFHYVDTDSTFKIIGGQWGKWRHYMAEKDGIVYNTYDGTEGAPAGFVQDEVQNIVIDPLPQPEPTPEPQPEPEHTEETPAEPAVAEHTVVEGDTLGAIVEAHYGPDNLWGPGGKVAEIAHVNGITDANVIQPGQVIKLP